jgi:polyphosphate kinase
MVKKKLKKLNSTENGKNLPKDIAGIVKKETGKIDLNNPEYFVNRELSWLKFNLRVLKTASLKEVPLIERLAFIAITSSNLDEFFMVRAAGLHTKLENGIEKSDAAGLTTTEQLREISESAHAQVKSEYSALSVILKELEEKGIVFKKICELKEKELIWAEKYYRESVYPVLTPMAVDASRPFPFLANKTLNLAIDLTRLDGEPSVGLVQVPSVLPRIIEIKNLDDEDSNGFFKKTESKDDFKQKEFKNRTFIYLEDLIATYCHELFSGCKIKTIVPFRITRDSDLDVDDEDTEDLLKEIEESLRKRKRGAAVRLELFKNKDERIKTFLMKNLEITEQEIYEITGPLDATCFFNFINKPGLEKYSYAPFIPQVPKEVNPNRDIFEQIKEKNIFIHHPYESFDVIVDLIKKAAEDPNVLAIKQTLYRVSGNSPIVAALARAAENGKQVTVLVELKARFDEENNIVWAKSLEKAGCHVIYGLVGLKTHAKIVLIVRKEADGIKRYVHMGTGNYNDKTAKLYTDMGIMTANDMFGSDASAFFNLLSGYAKAPTWNKIVMAPTGLRNKIYELIDNEIAIAKAGGKAYLIAKMNSLIDKEVIQKLYEASIAGVKIDLIVRGICGITSGVKGVSENISVRSIVGRLLEHSRIFYFYNGGDEQVYLSSADWMPRNLNDRVELFFPVEDERHIRRIKNILKICLEDNVCAYALLSNGHYRKIPSREDSISAQEIFYKEAKEAAKKEEMSLENKLKPIT